MTRFDAGDALPDQFHLETILESLGLGVASEGELVSGPYIQAALQLQAAPPAAYLRLNALMTRVLESLVVTTDR